MKRVGTSSALEQTLSIPPYLYLVRVYLLRRASLGAKAVATGAKAGAFAARSPRLVQLSKAMAKTSRGAQKGSQGTRQGIRCRIDTS